MKYILSSLVLFLSFVVNIYAQEDAILLKVEYKIIQHGTFLFLINSDSSQYRLITFTYDINLDDDHVFIGNRNEISGVTTMNCRSYKSSIKWNEKQLGSYREKYFKVIHENFLEMSNSEKIRLLTEKAK